MSRWVLRSGVNYKGLYDNLWTCFEPKTTGMNWPKIAYLVSLISCPCLCAIFGHFSTIPVGFRFAEQSSNLVWNAFGTPSNHVSNVLKTRLLRVQKPFNTSLKRVEQAFDASSYRVWTALKRRLVRVQKPCSIRLKSVQQAFDASSYRVWTALKRRLVRVQKP